MTYYHTQFLSECSLTTPDILPSTISSHCPEADGLYPVHNDCSAFYLCSDGKEHLVHCPPGLHYSEAYEICEAPCSALCNRSLGMYKRNSVTQN